MRGRRPLTSHSSRSDSGGCQRRAGIASERDGASHAGWTGLSGEARDGLSSHTSDSRRPPCDAGESRRRRKRPRVSRRVLRVDPAPPTRHGRTGRDPVSFGRPAKCARLTSRCPSYNCQRKGVRPRPVESVHHSESPPLYHPLSVSVNLPTHCIAKRLALYRSTLYFYG